MIRRFRRAGLLAALALYVLGVQAHALRLVESAAPDDCPMHGDARHQHGQDAADIDCDCERGDCHTAFKDRYHAPALIGAPGALGPVGAQVFRALDTGRPLSAPARAYRSRGPPVPSFS